MKTLRTAVVGVGVLGKHHLRWLSQLPESELVGLIDQDRERAEEFAQQYSVKAFDSIEQLADKVDAVCVVVPTSAHFEVASQLMERGVHCLIEKPVTSTLEDAKRLIQLAEEKKVKVAVGHIERFNPAALALADYDVRPSFVEAHRLAAFDPRGTDVAVVLDLMIHDIDLTLSLVRSPVTDIQASAVAVVSEQADIANARLTFENGAVANLTASRISLHAMRKLRIFQPDGYYSLDLATKQADLYRLESSDSSPQGIRLPLGKSGKDLYYLKKSDTGEDMLGAELQSFLRAVIEEMPVAVSLEDGTEALRTALEVQRIGQESLRRMLEGQQA